MVKSVWPLVLAILCSFTQFWHHKTNMKVIFISYFIAAWLVEFLSVRYHGWRTRESQAVGRGLWEDMVRQWRFQTWDVWCHRMQHYGVYEFSSREVLKEDESGSLKATVEDILFQSKRKRCVHVVISQRKSVNSHKGSYCCWYKFNCHIFYLVGW